MRKEYGVLLKMLLEIETKKIGGAIFKIKFEKGLKTIENQTNSLL
jgi:hypothetical protein